VFTKHHNINMIDSKFHKNNRRQISKTIPNCPIIITAYNKMQQSNDVAFRFKQESNFWWLTGIDEPNWFVIIDGISDKSWLVAPNISGAHKTFDGDLSFNDAMSISGVDGILNNDEATEKLIQLAGEPGFVYTVGDLTHAEQYSFVINPALQKLQNRLEGIFGEVRFCNLELSKLRAIKQPVEIEAIRDAVTVTINGFNKVKQNLSTFDYEYDAEAEFTYYFRKNGSNGHAFDPIIANGKNACTLHYISNNSLLEKGNLVLFDVGAQVSGYSADISRTYAIGELSERHIAVHDAVEQANQQIIELLRPGLKLEDYKNQVDGIMQNALRQLNLLSSSSDYARYFPHSVSHGLGVDTHDSLGQATEFLPGMVVTVEPGIYIHEENIGVRIEDDILITDDGHENLTAALDTSL